LRALVRGWVASGGWGGVVGGVVSACKPFVYVDLSGVI
jgi:hypothetical protein